MASESLHEGFANSRLNLTANSNLLSPTHLSGAWLLKNFAYASSQLLYKTAVKIDGILLVQQPDCFSNRCNNSSV